MKSSWQLLPTGQIRCTLNADKYPLSVEMDNYLSAVKASELFASRVRKVCHALTSNDRVVTTFGSSRLGLMTPTSDIDVAYAGSMNVKDVIDALVVDLTDDEEPVRVLPKSDNRVYLHFISGNVVSIVHLTLEHLRVHNAQYVLAKRWRDSREFHEMLNAWVRLTNTATPEVLDVMNRELFRYLPHFSKYLIFRISATSPCDRLPIEDSSFSALGDISINA